ncbi:MAG: polymerase sigma70 factor [Bacillales bacterium]|jgi:RNA polymerase sigma-70 factor (ECF subfamily)|nr:polymerase sigma70 factor [Bacillales bacterium]
MEFEQLSDEQLIQKIADGENILFRELISRYQSKVYAVAFKVANHPKDAEDVAQEVFIQIFRSLSQFKGDSAFSTWIYRITMNKALDLKRKQSRSPSFEFDVPIEIPTHRTPETELLQKEEQELARRYLDQLAENYREVVVLYYFHQLSYTEIATRLDIAIKTVESRLYRAKQMIRQKNLETKHQSKEEPKHATFIR